MYSMHWLLDVDNVYGYGACSAGAHSSKVSYINTYQRGPQESVWETVAHPSCETFAVRRGANGYLPLFIQDCTLRQAVALHRRAGRRRARRRGRVLGADVGDRAGQAGRRRGDRGQGGQDG